MQNICNDGSAGSVVPFDKEMMENLLQQEDTHHIDVFAELSEAHKEAVGKISDPEEQKKARRKLRKKLAKL